jgi:hypothetical protein
VTYEWFVNGTDASVSGATWTRHSTTTDLGHSIVVHVTYTPSGASAYAPITVDVVAQAGAAPIAAADPHGSAPFGSTLSTDAPSDFTFAADDTDSTFTYQWYLSGKAISGKTQSSYAPPSADVNHTVAIKVTARDARWNTATYTQTWTLLPAGPIAVAPTISPSFSPVRPGAVLTAHTGTLPSGAKLTYVWLSRTGSASFAPISGAIKSTYTVTTSDPTKDIEVLITATAPGWSTTQLASASVNVQYSLNLTATTDVSISTGISQAGVGKVGYPLTVAPATWNGTGLTVTYQWYQNGAAIFGATSTTFTPRGSQWGDDISVIATASGAGYLTATDQSDSITISNGDPPLPGSPAAAITLASGVYTVSPGAWSVDGLSYAYQWKVAGTDGIGLGATTNNYAPAGSEHGQLSVVITASRWGYTDGTKTVTGPTLP